MPWQEKIKLGMQWIHEGCTDNHSLTICTDCPFNKYCDAIQIGQEAGFNIDIPENWEEI